MEYVRVHGEQVPALGFGTWQLSGRECLDSTRDALELGYRHIDTAQMYGNEEEVGRAVADSGVDRGELFITTKLGDNADVAESTDGSLRKLRTDYVDLLLIHWPDRRVPLAGTLEAMLRLREAGKVRHVGVSNFPSALLREALAHAPVFTDQVEYHPYLGQDALLSVCREREVMLTAYSPLARGRVLRDPTLRTLAERHGRTPAQVVLRWLIQQPLVSAIPKAAGAANRRANLDIFDFALSEEEMGEITALQRGERLVDSADGPDWD